MLFRVVVVLISLLGYVIGKPLPLVIWHGLGDKYDNDGIVSVGDLAEKVNPGTFVYNIRLSNDSAADQRATFFGNLTDQVAAVCDDLSSHPVVSKASAINALGFSQGGQFLRAYIERCNEPPVQNLVTFGSQHNGISQFQTCAANDWLCKGANGLLLGNKWSKLVQGGLVPAQYFRDPEDLENYLEYSNFLADINNERETKTKSYAKNLAKLQRFVMFMFEDDQTVVPKESAWFTEVNGTTGEKIDVRNRTIYSEDWIGLKALDEKGGLVFRTTKGKHMQLSDDILISVFHKYFSSSTEEQLKPSEEVNVLQMLNNKLQEL